MMVKLLFVLDDLDAQEDGTEGKCGDEPHWDSFFSARLRGPDGHSHREAAGDQNDGIAEAEVQIEHVPRNTESRREFMAVDRVSQEEAAEKQDFCDQKDPHAEC